MACVERRCVERRPGGRGKRPWHDIGVENRSEDPDANDERREQQLLEWNRAVEELFCAPPASSGISLAVAQLPVQLWWDQWLWRSDPMQGTTVDAPFNSCQLHGLLVCRALPFAGVRCSAPLASLLPESGTRLSVCDVGIDSLNVRQLKDTLENLRQEWMGCQVWTLPGFRNVLVCLAARLGSLCSQHFGSDLDSVHDDEQVEPVDGGRQSRMTRASVRRHLNLLLAMFRAVHVHSVARAPDPASACCPAVQPIRKHHVFAGLDDFPALSMHWDLPLASVLNYVHDFAGMYNNVSQVVYYCYPDYKKRYPETTDLDAVASGTLASIYTLPSVLQMYTDVPVVYVDEHLDMTRPSGSHRWLVVDQQVYLLSKRNVLYSDPNLVRLVHQLHHLQLHGE